MEEYILPAAHLVLATPCLFLGIYFYKKQRRELDVTQRAVQRLAIVWCGIVFVIVSLSLDDLWATYIAGT